MKIYSWNVNGIRACREKGFLNWLEASQADVVFLQETKAHQEQLCAELVQPPGYETHWFSAEKKGYSSVAAYCRTKPDEVQKGLGHGKFDIEGRSITVFYGKLAMIGAYFPNSQDMGARLGYKMEFCQAMLEYCRNLRNKGYSVVLAGDYNIAHKPIDLARPKENETSAGYLPEERAWMTEFISAGYSDVFRKKTGEEPHHYTWWTFRAGARKRNIGWRIDYTNVSNDLLDKVSNVEIHPSILGSDHCPVSLQLN